MLLESLQPMLRSKQLPPILFLFGEEEFLLDEAYQSIMKSVTESGIDAMNIDILDGDECTQESIVHIASSYPMMGERRIVTVKRFEKVHAGKRSKNAGKTSRLAQYIRSPSPTTTLILKVNDQRVVAEELKGLAAALTNPKQKNKAADKIKKLKFPYDLLIEHSDWIEFPTLYERDIPSWVAKRFSSRSMTIAPDACDYLLSQVGFSLRDISNEIEKIITYTQSAKNIYIDDVINVVGASRTYNVFELQKAIGQRNIVTSLDILQNMIKYDSQELLIISMLTRYITSLWKIKEVITKTSDVYEIAKIVGISSFFVPDYIAVSKRYSDTDLENAFIALHLADTQIKSSSQDSLIIMQQMVISIVESGHVSLVRTRG